MPFQVQFPRRILLCWIVPLTFIAGWIALRTILQGNAVRDGFVNPWLLVATVMALWAVGLWLEQQWSRWLGLTILASTAGWITYQIVLGNATLWALLALPLLAVAVGLLWRLKLFAKDNSENHEDEPFLSLVLLFREPQYLDAAILAQLASDAWSTEVDVVESDEEEDDFEGESDTGPTRSLVGGAMPHFFGFHPPAFFTIHCFDEPYFEDPEDIAGAVPELRAQQAIAQHRAWLSVDLIHWMGENQDQEEAYRLIGKLLAELADENCLAVLDPVEGRIFVYDPETERKLRSDNPLHELQELYYAPIATIDGDNEDMKAAVAEARRRWPEFVASFENRSNNDDTPFLIKAPFSRGEFTEYMWVKVTGIEHQVVYGELGNEPANIRGLHEGDRVRVREDDINDWMCVIHGKPLGGFTLKVLGRNFEEE